MDDLTIELVAADFDSDKEEFQLFIDYCIKIELLKIIECNRKKYLTCPLLDESLSCLVENRKKERLKKQATKVLSRENEVFQGENRDIPRGNEVFPIKNTQSKEKESKVKKRKENNIIDSSLRSESQSSDEPMTVGDDERNSGGVGFDNREEGSSLKDTEKVKIRKQERCGNDSLDNRGGSSSDKEINLPAFIEFFNRTLKEHHSVIPPIVKIGGQRKERLLARVKEYSKEALMKAVINAATAPFLNGASDKPFVASLDWIVRPNNFPKVLEGNYNHTVINPNTQLYGTSSSNNGYRTAEDLRQGAATIISRRAAASQQPDEELPVV